MVGAAAQARGLIAHLPSLPGLAPAPLALAGFRSSLALCTGQMAVSRMGSSGPLSTAPSGGEAGRPGGPSVGTYCHGDGPVCVLAHGAELIISNLPPSPGLCLGHICVGPSSKEAPVIYDALETAGQITSPDNEPALTKPQAVHCPSAPKGLRLEPSGSWRDQTVRLPHV